MNSTLQDIESRIQEAKAALGAAQSGGDPALLAAAHNSLAHLQALHGEFTPALGNYLAGLEASRQAGRKNLECEAIKGVATLQHNLGNYQEAAKYFLRALTLERELGDLAGEAGVLGSLGQVYLEMGDYAGAAQLHRDALTIARETDDREGQARTLSHLGAAYRRLGRTVEAIAFHQQALEIVSELGQRQTQATVLENLGYAYVAQGNLAEALKLHAQALELQRALGNRPGEASALLHVGAAHLALGQTEAALKALYAALTIAEDLGTKRILLETHQTLSTALEAGGDPQRALQHLKIASELERGLFQEQQAQKTAALLAGFQMEKVRQEAEIERIKNTELAEALQAAQQAEAEKSRLLERTRQQAEELERLARQDPLTRLHNRRYLEENLEREFAASRRYNFALAVALLDIDNFKTINDTFSHQIGDDVLRLLAQILENPRRETDFVARYGGEEFALVFPQTDLDGALIACERLRTKIERFEWRSVHPNLRVTVSIGVSDDPLAPNHEKLLAQADEQLYAAKRSGKNRVRPE